MICINKACSDNDGFTTFYKNDKYSTLHSIKINKGGESQKIETCKLDTILSTLNVGNVKLIKIDVEGAELDVIKGAIETIRRYQPNIIFEAWNEKYLLSISKVLKKYKYEVNEIKEACYLAVKAHF